MLHIIPLFVMAYHQPAIRWGIGRELYTPWHLCLSQGGLPRVQKNGDPSYRVVIHSCPNTFLIYFLHYLGGSGV